MRTGGDDVAQALALLGVRPTWEVASRRLTGFEILPLSLLAGCGGVADGDERRTEVAARFAASLLPAERFTVPTTDGTDEIGRDLFVRTAQGGRYSIRIGLLAAIVA